MASKRDPSDTLAPCLRIQVYLIECVGSDQLFNICMQYIKRECGNSRKLLCKLECGGTVQVYHQGLFQTPFYFILQQTRQVDRAYLYLVFTQCCSACPFYQQFFYGITFSLKYNLSCLHFVALAKETPMKLIKAKYYWKWKENYD